MTTHTYNTVLAHANDADFRAWGLELHNALVAVGLVNTADTGQIDFATVLRPAINTAAGYKIYYLNDSLHATHPVYLKIEFGTSGTATYPQGWITMGIGTNGAGTLNPTLLTSRVAFMPTSAPASAVINYPTFVCSVAGYVGVSFKRGAQSGHSYGGFHVCRSFDESGLPSTEGAKFYFAPSSLASYSSQQLYFSPALQRASGSNYCLIADRISSDTSTAVGLKIQTYKHYAAWPRMRCNPCVLAYFDVDIPADTEFTQTPVGSTPRNYRALGNGWSHADGSGGMIQIKAAMLWE